MNDSTTTMNDFCHCPIAWRLLKFLGLEDPGGRLAAQPRISTLRATFTSAPRNGYEYDCELSAM